VGVFVPRGLRRIESDALRGRRVALVTVRPRADRIPRVLGEAEDVLEGQRPRDRRREVGEDADRVVVHPRASHRVVVVDLEARDGLPRVHRQGRAPEVRVPEVQHRDSELRLSPGLVGREQHLVAGEIRPLLPAAAPLHPAREVQGEVLVDLGADVDLAIALVEGAEAADAGAAPDVSGSAVLFGVDRDHPGEGGHAVQRSLGAARDLDAVDVLDRDLGEVRVERSAHRHAVHRDHQGVELLDAVEADVRQARAVVGAVARIETDDVLESLRERRRSSAPQLLPRDDRDVSRDVDRVLRDLGGRDDHFLVDRLHLLGRGRRGRRDGRGPRCGSGGRALRENRSRARNSEQYQAGAAEAAQRIPVHRLVLPPFEVFWETTGRSGV